MLLAVNLESLAAGYDIRLCDAHLGHDGDRLRKTPHFLQIGLLAVSHIA